MSTIYFGRSEQCPVCLGDGVVTNFLDIVEALGDNEAEAIANKAREVVHENSILIEVGSWKGLSTSYLSNVAQECKGNLYCIDHWKGNNGTKEHMYIKDCLSIFCRNMDLLNRSHVIRPMVMSSQQAISVLKENVADFIFIDADHTYESIKADIQAYWKILKVGGYICGHDCERKYSEFTEYEQAHFTKYLQQDYSPELKCHPGVVKSLNEIWGDDYDIIPGTTIWCKRKY